MATKDDQKAIPKVGATAFWIAGMRMEETEKALSGHGVNDIHNSSMQKSARETAVFSDPFARVLLTGGESHFAEFRRCGGIPGWIAYCVLQFVVFPIWALVSDTASMRPFRALKTALRNMWRSAFLSPYGYTYTEHVRRTRFIDDIVLAECKRGTTQVVSLGAGLDTRSLRLPLPRGVLALEIDHPSIFAHKEPLLESALATGGGCAAASRARRTVLPTAYERTFDFASDPRVAEAGFCPGSPSVFVCEGLTMYLSDEQQEALFRALGTAAAAGSVVTGDTYVFPGGKGAKAAGMSLNSLTNDRLRSLLGKAGFAVRRLLASTEDEISFGTPSLPCWGDYEQFPAQRFFFEAVKE